MRTQDKPYEGDFGAENKIEERGARERAEQAERARLEKAEGKEKAAKDGEE